MGERERERSQQVRVAFGNGRAGREREETTEQLLSREGEGGGRRGREQERAVAVFEECMPGVTHDSKCDQVPALHVGVRTVLCCDDVVAVAVVVVVVVKVVVVARGVVAVDGGMC